MFDYEEWIEMEEETKKLHNLVKTQREQIDKLVELLTQASDIQNIPTTSNDEKHPITTNSLHLSLRQLPTNIPKKCSVCNYEFPTIYTETQIANHIENCLFKSDIVDLNVSMESKQLECPYCNEKLPNNDDIIYTQHLSQCFNEMTGNF